MGTGHDQPQDGNVLSMAQKARASGKIDRVEKYWNTVRGNRLVPSRSEIDPRGLDGVLGHAFILERITGGLARFRIAGSHLTDLTGLELRQMPLSALFLPGSRDVLSEAMEAVFDEPAVIRMEIASPASIGREPLTGEMILLPLRSDLGDVDRVLGGIVLDGRVGRTPRRIEVLGQTRQTLTGYAGPRFTGDDAKTPPVTARRPSREAPRPTPQTGRDYLKLVVSND
ncbi:MAG: PAS domain-containing protein [Paracoccaceae bacterium]